MSVNARFTIPQFMVGTAVNSTPSVIVADAGTVAANGTYTERGTNSGKPYYNLVGQPDDFSVSSIAYGLDGDTLWYITSAGSAWLYLGLDSGVDFPWLNVGWSQGDGDLPVPTVTEG